MSINEPSDDFRDKISTVGKDGKRVWIHPKKPKGAFHNKRIWVSIGLLILLFSGPFIKINGNPILMMNVIERRFSILGKIFWPQDFFLFAVAMITMVVFIILFTVVFGRLFCGWICPQTIFMEMVFRKIEYWIEGDFKQQKKLKKQEWDAEKIKKRGLKHSIFYLISFLISNMFLAYIIGDKAWLAIVTDPPGEHVGGLLGILFFSGVFYLVFSTLREQVCTTICPYGRLQGVLLDRKSIVVAYDWLRGEKRAKFKKNEDRKVEEKGDCIDCHQCVDVCPTGIDIRNGTQLECVNCTACIDACDFVMEKVGLEKGLIRYVSEEGIAKGERFSWTPRIISYTAVLTAMIGVVMVMLLSRSDLEATIIREPGTLFQKMGDGYIANIYTYSIVNKTNDDLVVAFKLESTHGSIQMIGHDDTLRKQDGLSGKFFIKMHEDSIFKRTQKIKVGVYSKGEFLDHGKSTFVGPVTRQKKQ